MRRRIAVLTTGRQDWGILRSTCVRLREDRAWDLKLLVGGMHLAREFGQTEFDLHADGFKADESLPWMDEGQDTGALEQAGRGLPAVGQALERQRPEGLILVGDRFETAAAAIAATLVRVPLIHLHGGEETEGAIDNAFRHAITQLSSLHFVSHPVHEQRVVSMGIDPSVVHVVGAPGLDNLLRGDLPTRDEVAQRLGLKLAGPVVVVTLHPTTASKGSPSPEVGALCEAMDSVDATYVITLPNTDPGHGPIRDALLNAAKKHGRVAVEALGSRFYWGLLNAADAMLGNSSSAIIEGAALGVPAVNLGDRQKGRLRGQNVIDVPVDARAIAQALARALAADTQAASRASKGPFGEGRSAERIVEILAAWRPPFSMSGVPAEAH